MSEISFSLMKTVTPLILNVLFVIIIMSQGTTVSSLCQPNYCDTIVSYQTD